MLEQWGLWYQQGDSGLAQKVRLQFGIVEVWLKLSSGIGRINIEEILGKILKRYTGFITFAIPVRVQ
jgi:hypothetical protein